MRPFQESIPKCVIQLLLTCPPDSLAIRKDILVATRHILATDFRAGFFNQVDVLLDEKVLIGGGGASSRASHETLRPLACSTLADLVHHVRGELSIAQLSRVVYIFSCNIHDVSLPLSIQTTSVRLLLNLVESIFHKNEPQARTLLVRILHCLVFKFTTLKAQIPIQLQLGSKPASTCADSGKAEAAGSSKLEISAGSAAAKAEGSSKPKSSASVDFKGEMRAAEADASPPSSTAAGAQAPISARELRAKLQALSLIHI